jgi:NADH pyrophosphatase NudC (nudix superfamily)
VHLEQFLQGNEGLNALMIAYVATMVDPAAAFVLPPEEVAEVRWVGKDAWRQLPLFPEYRRALEVYFASL